MSKSREITLDENELSFSYLEDGDLVNEIAINAGYQYLIDTFFLLDIPTEAEVEKASNYFEDEMMKEKKLVNNNESLLCENALLADLLGVTSKSMMTKDMVDLEYNKYAEYIEGEPEHILGITFTKEKFVMLYLLRDVMYYLKFSAVTIIR